MRTSIKKGQVKYLADSIEQHLNNLPDDHARWITALKFVWGVYVTMDNMGVFEYNHDATVITLDKMFEQLRNEFASNDMYMPEACIYYK